MRPLFYLLTCAFIVLIILLLCFYFKKTEVNTQMHLHSPPLPVLLKRYYLHCSPLSFFTQQQNPEFFHVGI